MALDDLDLEFEDEEDIRKRKNEAVHVDVDLEFSSPEHDKSRANIPIRPVPGAPTPVAGAQPSTKNAEVRKIEDARVAQAKSSPPPAPGSRPGVSSPPRAVGSSALKQGPDYDLDSVSIVEMREQLRKTELDSQVKVAVAEFKADYLIEMVSDMKLVEHQIGQLLARIHAKHPEMKNEVLMIKKILADFNAKKRK